MDVKKFVLSYYSNATEDFYINEITKPRDALSLHSHDYYQIYYLKSGRLIHRLEHGSAELKAGDVFIIPPNLPHYVQTSTKEVCFYSISFMPDYVREMLDANRFVADFIHCITDISPERALPCLTLHPEDTELTDTLVSKILKEFSSDLTGKDSVIKSSLALLLSVFARAYLDEQFESIRFSSERAAIAHCLGYIKNHLSEPITLSEMAQRTAMSKTAFCECFRRITGETFKSYLGRERVVEAAAMIRSGKRVAEAAAALGYSDLSTFYRNFKKHLGLSPSEYKP